MKSSSTIHTTHAIAFLLILALSQQISFAQVGVNATIYPALSSCSAPSFFVDEEVLPETATIAPVITAANTTTYTTDYPTDYTTAANSAPIATSTASARFFSTTAANTSTIDVKGAGTGSKVEIPTGLTVTAAAWNGMMDVTYTTRIPAAITDMTSAKVITIDMGCVEHEPVALSDAALVTVPYANFGDLARPMVKVIDNSGVVYSLSACAASQYVSSGLLNKSTTYDLASFANGGAQHCYKYDTAHVYIASNHFSTFVVGEADPVQEISPVVYTGGSATIDLSAQVTNGVVTLAAPVAVTLTTGVAAEGVGSKVDIPTGLVMSATGWDGGVDVGFNTTVPSGVTSGKVVSITFSGATAGQPVKLSSAALVTIPLAGFSPSLDVAKIIGTDNITYAVAQCTTQYDGGDKSLVASYTLGNFASGAAAAQQCYTYDASNVYIISNHFTSFVAGRATVAPIVIVNDNSSGGGGIGSGGGGGSSNYSSPSFPQSSPEAPIAPSVPSPRSACRFKTVQPKKFFTDVPLNVWYSPAITRLITKGILKKKTSQFKPGEPLRRADALILAMDAFGIKPAAKLSKDPFRDVRMKDAFAGYVKAGVDHGIVIIKTAFFYPNRIISRAEAAAILLRAGKISLVNYVSRVVHRDVSANQWYAPVVGKAWDLCVIVGYANGTVRPTQDVINAEFVVMIDRIMQHLGR